MSYDLHSAFDYAKHKETFIHYFEAIILPNGIVEYAVPSHQEKLIKIGMNKHKLTREQYDHLCPVEYYCDYLTWLLKDTKCIACWTDHYEGTPNRFQKHTLERLHREGIMEAAAIPGESEDNYFNPKSVYAYLKEKETSEKAIQLIKKFVSECRESDNKNPDDNICDSDCKNCTNHGYCDYE